MPTTSVQKVSTEEVKQAILALIKENNAEFKQLLTQLLPSMTISASKKNKKTAQSLPTLPLHTERIPYDEMPFWKANPHLKPLKSEGLGVSKEALFELIHEFQETFSELDISDEEWLEQIKD